MATTGNPTVPCFVWWSKHLLDMNVTQGSFSSTYVSNLLSFRPLSVEQVIADLWGLAAPEEDAVSGMEPLKRPEMRSVKCFSSYTCQRKLGFPTKNV